MQVKGMEPDLLAKGATIVLSVSVQSLVVARGLQNHILENQIEESDWDLIMHIKYKKSMTWDNRVWDSYGRW